MLEYIELKDEKPTKLLTLTFDELYTDDNIQKVIQHLKYSSLNQVNYPPTPKAMGWTFTPIL